MPRKVEEIYQKKSQLEHILLRPDTYVGSIERETFKIWALNAEKTRMLQREVSFVPALYKIFDEILVNAADNKQRDPKGMRVLEVDIDEEKGCITVTNDGRGIPIQIHREHDIYVPELIFGHLLTSSNYNDNEKKTVGGRNGFGAKLANIFSRRFIIDTVDSAEGLRYLQEWTHNMRKKKDHSISDSSKKDYTRVKFFPDFARFGMDGFDDDILALMEKRVYDIAGCTPSDLTVKFNGQRVKVKSFVDYAKLFLGPDVKKGVDYIHERMNERWEVIFALSPDQEYRQVSHVNSIWTIKGGTHVKAVLDQLIGYCKANFKDRSKAVKEMLKPQYIRNQVFVFINCLIENPAFSSQTKEELTLSKTKFGSSFEVDVAVLKKVHAKIKDQIKLFLQLKLQQQSKKSDGKKKKRLNLDEQIDDAMEAGGKKSQECTLILTEGLSAKTLAVAGVGELRGGKRLYGIFPLKGKLLNTREESRAKINKNTEIRNLKQILGLKQGTNYSEDAKFRQLRYGKVMIMTDQDHDGSHIKGLVVNFIHSEWPELVRRQGFLSQFITPIVVAKRGNQEIQFYTIPEYENWKRENNNGRGWKCKYYKGLGTWDRRTGKEHFKRLAKNKIRFQYRGDPDDEAIDMAFNKKKTEDRKQWLQGFREGTYLDFTRGNVSYREFVDRELILFSVEDCKRSIPSMVDGLKPGQRKVLYCCFLRNLKKEIRVAQLGGYVSEKSAYHHGEASLYATIINMAQNFVGSNNVNLLEPLGMFGSRLRGGKDAASPRYIHTRLAPIARSVFVPSDDMVLKYLDDDGYPVEPEFYVPILPMVLVNGAEGIGTGWSTSVPCYNPRDIIANIRRRLNGEDMETMMPWYRGFTGTIRVNTGKKGVEPPSIPYLTEGNCDLYEEKENGAHLFTLEVTELPIGVWTDSFKKHLIDLEDSEQIVEFADLSSDVDVSFQVTFDFNQTKADAKGSAGNKSRGKGKNASKGKGSKGTKKKNEEDSKTNSREQSPSRKKKSIRFNGAIDDQFLREMKLTSSFQTSNLVLYDGRNKLRKYPTVEAIMEDFCTLRLDFYQLRKAALLEQMEHKLKKISNQARFILMVVERKLVISRRKKVEIVKDLIRHKFATWKPHQNKNTPAARRAMLQKIDGTAEEKEDGQDDNDEETKSDDSDGDQTMEDASASRISEANVKARAKGFDYLLSMPLWSLTHERVEKLLQEKKEQEHEIDALTRLTTKELWLRDLDALEEKLDFFDKEYEQSVIESRKTAQAKLGKAKTTKGKGKGRANVTRRKVPVKRETSKPPPRKPVGTRKVKKTTTATKRRVVADDSDEDEKSGLSKYFPTSSSVSSSKSSSKASPKKPSNPVFAKAQKKGAKKSVAVAAETDEESSISPDFTISLKERIRLKRASESPVKVTKKEKAPASRRQRKRRFVELESDEESEEEFALKKEDNVESSDSASRSAKPPSKRRRGNEKTPMSVSASVSLEENEEESESNAPVLRKRLRRNRVQPSYADDSEGSSYRGSDEEFQIDEESESHNESETSYRPGSDSDF